MENEKFVKKFEVRWSDLDANRHVANSAYVNFMSHTRMCFLEGHGIGQAYLRKHGIGPILFNEEIHYFQEVLANDTVYVDMELHGKSEDSMFVEFSHSLFNSQRKLCVYGKVSVSWIDMRERKLAIPPIEIQELWKKMPKSADFRILTKSDTRKINPKLLQSTLDEKYL